MSDDLVTRLRDCPDMDAVDEAADALEAQAARIAELEAALATARRDALAEIKQDTDELIEQGMQDGMEEAAQIADGRPSDCGEDIAAAIRAAARVEKP